MTSAENPIQRDYTVPARGHLGLRLGRGQTLRIVDLGGVQAVDLVALSQDDPREALSMIYTKVLNRAWRLRVGDTLYSNRARPVLRLVGDTVGMHSLEGGYCTPAINAARFGDPTLPSCGENFRRALESEGLDEAYLNFDACLNLFMDLQHAPEGELNMGPSVGRAGDHVDLLAEADLIVAISACPQDRNPVNGFNPTPIQVQVLAPT